MSKKLIILSLVSSLLLSGCSVFNLEEYLEKTGQKATSQEGSEQHGGGGESSGSSSSSEKSDEEKEAYDQWLNSISKPGHLYFHYNRGDKGQYDQYCLWLWQHAPSDLEGTLWAYSGDPVVSPKLTLKPMSTAWMTYDEVQKGSEGSGMYCDDYGVIADVDLYKSGLIGGKTGSATSFEGANELGFLMVKQSSMDGSTNWTSDGGKETYIEEFDKSSNWRDVAGGKAIHVFVSTGSLKHYSFFAGSGVPQARTNPIDLDDTGKYSSTIDPTYNDAFNVSSTSEAFKKLGVGYQIFVASFKDSNGDGYGDIRGIIDSLDYLEDLGVECLWLTPIQKSDSYHGYDISDYYAIDKRFGTIEDYRELIYKAHQKGMKVLMDLVLNHTSKSNVWFENSQWGVTETGAKNEWRDIYTWKYKTDMIDRYNPTTGQYEQKTVQFDAESNNPSWYRDGESNYYYYGKFGSGMPEINYQNTKTRQLVIDMAKYWMSFGLDGYRLDAVKHIFMRDECYQSGDTIITDVGQKTAWDTEKGQMVTKDFDYSSNVTKNVTWWKEFANALKADYPNCFLVGENFDGWGTRTAPYYQALDSQFSFSTYYHIPAYLYANAGGASNFASKQASETYEPFASSSDSIPLADTGLTVKGGHRPDFIDGAFTSNHDVMRAINQVNGAGTIDGTTAKATITGTNEEINHAKVHAAVTILDRGISWIYYGDELGMSSNTERHNDQDHYPLIGENNIDIWYRQPFLWHDTTKRANYRAGEFRFELDSYNSHLADAETQMSTAGSMYNWYKDLIEIKKMYPDDARITYHPTSGNHVMVIRVNDAYGTCKLVIYINTGTGTGTYQMDPGYIATGQGMSVAATAVKTMNGAPANAGGDIGAVPYGISVFQFNNQEEMNMNKKLLLLFPLIALGVSSCVKYNGKDPKADKSSAESETSESASSEGSSSSSEEGSGSSGSESSESSSEGSSEEEEPTFGEEVTTYLVLGEYGLFRGEPGTTVPDKFLENTISYKAKIGSPLPTKTDITTTVSGSSFVCWQTYENTGSPKEYSVVPAKEGVILYAKFSGGSGGGGGGGGGGDGLPTEGFGFMFTDSSYVVGTLQDEKDAQGRIQYKISDYAFHTGDTFQLYDFANKAGWVENLDPYSFNNTSGSGNFWPHYINKGSYYTVLTDFTAEVYLKMAYEDNVIYFGIKSGILPDLPDEGGETPTPGGTDFGIQMNDTAQTFYSGVKQGEPDAQGREQYKIANLELHEGDEFRIYDNTNHAGWVETLDAYSFGGDPEHGHGEVWKSYLSMGTSYYTALDDMVVDVYLKLKFEDNLIYFGLVSGGDDPVDPPEPTDTGYGIRYYDGSTVKGTEGEESEGFTQWVLENVTFETGDQFQIYDFSTEVGWAVTVNTYSFNSDPDSYIIKGESIYAILQDCTVDIYIKLKYGADEIYFDLKSGGGDDPTPVDPDEAITIYFAGVSGWADMGEVQIGLTESTFGVASATTTAEDQAIGQYKRVIPASAAASELHCYFTNNQSQYRHPAHGDNDDTMYSTIDLGEVSSLQLNHSYVITWTGWARNLEDWSHAWFNYTFAEVSSTPTPDPDPDPQPEQYITIYFAGVSGWSDMKEVHIGLTTTDLATASVTTTAEDQAIGQYKRVISASTASTELHCYFVNTSNQYRHPTSGSQDWDTEYSTISLGSVTSLQPGHSYVITYTGWHYNYDNWEHAWFNYTFEEYETQVEPD